jgi:hypothetical protein
MAAVAVSADRLGRRFGDLEAVRDISFDVAEGEAFGFLVGGFRSRSSSALSPRAPSPCSLSPSSSSTRWSSSKMTGSRKQR